MIFHSQHVLTTFLKEMKSFYWASPWKDLLRGEECTCLLPFVSFSLASHTTKAVLTNQANNICKEPHTHTITQSQKNVHTDLYIGSWLIRPTSQKKIQNKIIIIIITSVITNRRKQRHLFVAHFWYLHSLLNSQNNCSSRCWAACCCLAMGGGKWVGSQSF